MSTNDKVAMAMATNPKLAIMFAELGQDLVPVVATWKKNEAELVPLRRQRKLDVELGWIDRTIADLKSRHERFAAHEKQRKLAIGKVVTDAS